MRVGLNISPSTLRYIVIHMGVSYSEAIPPDECSLRIYLYL